MLESSSSSVSPSKLGCCLAIFSMRPMQLLFRSSFSSALLFGSDCFSFCAQLLRRFSQHGVHGKQQQEIVVGCRYILPSLSLVPSDHEEGVKVQYALVLAQLAGAANRFLLHLQHLANTQLQPHPSSPTLVSHLTPHYDLHSCCREHSYVCIA